MTPSNADKAIYRTLAAAFGTEKPDAFEYWDDSHRSSVHVVTATDRPDVGVTSYGTLGLSNHLLAADGEESHERWEMLGACSSEADYFGNVIATAAFNAINSGASVLPGSVHADVISMYDRDRPMKHLLFVSTLVWDDGPHPMYLRDKSVAFVFALPISDDELAYADRWGGEHLEDLFDGTEFDVLDLDRPSIV